MATEKQIAANRRNAEHSTGPTSDSGKAKSRRNALKHGLAATVLVPGEDTEELALRVSMMQNSLAPDGDGLALIFGERAGYLSLRLKRCFQAGEAHNARRVRDALADYDEARRAEADRTLDYIAHEPAAGIRRLQATPEGIDLLIRSLQDLREQADGRWTDHHGLRFDQYTGRRPGHLPVCRVAALSELIGRNNAEYLDPAELEAISPTERRAWAIAQIGPLIDAEIARLRALLPTLDHARFAQNRAEAARRALECADNSLDQLRKYEAAADRALTRTLAQLTTYRRECRPFRPEELTAERAETNHECAAEMAEARQSVLANDRPPAAPELGSFEQRYPELVRPINALKFAIGKPPIAPPTDPKLPRQTP